MTPTFLPCLCKTPLPYPMMRRDEIYPENIFDWDNELENSFRLIQPKHVDGKTNSKQRINTVSLLLCLMVSQSVQLRFTTIILLVKIGLYPNSDVLQKDIYSLLHHNVM